MTFASNASGARSTLTAWWYSVKWSLRLRLRRWLGIEALNSQQFDRTLEINSAISLHAEKIYTLEQKALTLDAGMEGLNASDANHMKLISEVSANLQAQISELKNGPVASYGAPESPTEQVQMHAGHVRFSDRKRQYEAEHRRPISTEAGKQIAENARIIASGTRKTDDKS